MNTEQQLNLNLAKLVREATNEDGMLMVAIGVLSEQAVCRELMVAKYLRSQGYFVKRGKGSEVWEAKTTTNDQLRSAFRRFDETLIKHKPGRAKKIF